MTSRPRRRVRGLAAAVLLLSAACSSGGKGTASGGGTTTSVPPVSAPTTVASPSTSSSVASTQPSGPAGGPVPAGFVPQSVTFVSLRTGWVLGNAPCAKPPCTSVLRTQDGGATWTGIPAPSAPLSTEHADGSVSRIRFADAQNGWVYGPALWVTHDGGAHWAQPALAGAAPKGRVDALEAAAGVVHAVVFDGTAFRIQTSPVATDGWKQSPASVPTGAGPVPQPQLVLQGSSGWMVLNNRTVVGGARLVRGQWATWQPPCTTVGGPAVLAASSESDVVAACDEGIWTGTTRVERLYASQDGGTTFRVAGEAAPIGCCGAVAAPVAGTAVAGGPAGDPTSLLRSPDGGLTWATVYQRRGSASWTDLGFTTAERGVGVDVAATGQSGELVMSDDGGRTWRTVAFKA